MDRLDAMQAFVTVAELKGFAQAARKLAVSPPTVTRLIASLEARLAVSLFQRTTRAVRLTDAGARYLPKAKSIVDAVREAEATTHAEQPTPSGHFVITAPVLFGRLEVAPLVSLFLSRHPGVTAELLLLDRVVNLVEEGVDVALRIGVLDDSSLRSRVLGSTRRVLVASPSYLARRGRPKKPDDLKSHAMINVTGLGKGVAQPCFITNSADAAIEHALRGGGIASLLAYQVSKLVSAGKLEVLLANFEPEPRPIQLVYPASRMPSANVRAFIDLAAERTVWQFTQFFARGSDFTTASMPATTRGKLRKLRP